MTLDQRRQSLLSSVGGAVAQSVPSFISTDRSPQDRTAVRSVAATILAYGSQLVS